MEAGGWGVALLGWCIIFCLLFVLLFIDRLIVTLDMSGVMEDLGTKTQVAAPRHCLTSQTGELIKHDQYWSPPPLPFIHLFIFFRLGLKKNVCHQKLKRQTSSLHSSYFSINLVFVDSYSSVSTQQVGAHNEWICAAMSENTSLRSSGGPDIRYGKEKVRVLEV